MADDVRALLGKFADAATDADVRRLEQALKSTKDSEQKAVIGEFKKLLRNRTAVATAKPLAENTAAVNKTASKPEATKAKAAPAAAIAGDDDEEDFVMESLF